MENEENANNYQTELAKAIRTAINDSLINKLRDHQVALPPLYSLNLKKIKNSVGNKVKLKEALEQLDRSYKTRISQDKHQYVDIIGAGLAAYEHNKNNNVNSIYSANEFLHNNNENNIPRNTRFGLPKHSKIHNYLGQPPAAAAGAGAGGGGGGGGNEQVPARKTTIRLRRTLVGPRKTTGGRRKTHRRGRKY